jgi:hypothetical protein
MDNTVWEDLAVASKKAGFTASFVAVFSIIISYFLTIHPYHKTGNNDNNLVAINPRNKRIIPDYESQKAVRRILKFSESTFSMDNVQNSLKYREHAPEEGHVILPELFYNGIFISIEIPDKISYSILNSIPEITNSSVEYLREILYKDMLVMNPRPNCILDKVSYHPDLIGGNTSSLVAYFSQTSLKKQGKLSQDSSNTWINAIQEFKVLARKYGQMYITYYYPHQFGEIQTDKPVHHYSTIMQIVEPTRTGYQKIRSSTPVHRLLYPNHDPSHSLFMNQCRD